jgi:methylmalonyl-CoA mutase N-terminal domain/subunit
MAAHCPVRANPSAHCPVRAAIDTGYHQRMAGEPGPLRERRNRFSTISDVEIRRVYGPDDRGGGASGRHGIDGGVADPQGVASDRGGGAFDRVGGPSGRGYPDDGGGRPGIGNRGIGSLVPDIGVPGAPPFTRGIHPTGYRGRLWTMRMFAGFGSAEDTNARFRALLDAGQTGLSVAYDMPTLYGYDTDDAEAEGEFGTCGVAVSSLADMEVLLAGLPLDRVSTSMTINAPAAPIWAMYIVAAEKAGVPRAVLEGTIQNDILKEYIAQKEFLFPPGPSMRLVTDTIEFGTKELPRWNTVSISGYHIREAGATAVQELAFTIADGMAYVEAALARGLAIDSFAPRLSFFFNSHSDFFEEIAKFRASRRIWWRLMTERYRAKNERSTWMRFHTQTAGVSLAPQQPLNNLTRVATQALAAVLGGTQSLHTDAYDEALAVPTEAAALLALRQQQVIAEETGVANTVDPMGGSWFVEALTDETERAAWRYLDEIDERGGMVAAVEAGYPQREIADAAYRYQRELEAGERVVVGVNSYVDDSETLRVPVLQVPEGSLARQLERLERTRRERDNEAVQAALAGLRDAASRPESSATNLMPHFIRCAGAYATLGEQCAVLRAVFGEYREPVAI